MRKVISIALVCSMLLTLFTALPVFAEAESISVAPAADTYVDCRNNPQVNYGGEQYMSVRRVGNTTFAVLKFDLPEIPEGKSVTGAALKLTNRGIPASAAGIEYYAAKLSGDDWTELGLVGSDVYSTRTPDAKYTYPAAGTSKCYTAYPDGAEQYSIFEMDVSSIINYDYTYGNTTTSILIGTDVDKNADGGNLSDWSFYAKEAENYAPQLVLTLGEESYSELEIIGECLENNITRSGNYADDVQDIGNIVLTKDNRKGYLKFDVSQIPEGFTVVDAKIQMTIDSKADMEDGIIELYSINNGWTEDTITWSNAPETISKRAVNVFSADKKTTTFDVTDYVQEKVYNGSSELSVELASLYITTIEGGNNNVNLYGRTNATSERQPKLIMTVTNNPDAALIAEDKINVTIPEIVYGDIDLPLEGINGSSIVWESSDPEAVSETGKVTRGTEDKNVVLTAHFTYADTTMDKVFNIMIPEYIEESGKVQFYNAAGLPIDELTDEETVYATVKFAAPSSGEASVIVARYNNYGNLMTVGIDGTITMEQGEEVIYQTAEANTSRADIVKVFVWDSFDNINPILENCGNIVRTSVIVQ